jgi:phage-related protein
MTILKISAFYQFRNNSCYIAATYLTVFFLNQKFCYFFLLLMQNNCIKLKIIDCLINLIKKSFHFFFRNIKIIVDHFFKISSFGLIAINILIYYISNILNGVDIVYSFVFGVMLNASFSLANCAGTSAGETTS